MTEPKIVEAEEAACVYDVLMAKEIVYVGIAVDPETRWMTHRQKKRFPKSARFKVYKWYNTRYEAMMAEGRRQRKLLPRMCRKIEGGAPKGYRVLPWNDNMFKIRRLVREEGMTLKAVGKRYGVSAQTVSRHLNEFETDFHYLFDHIKEKS